ncbi:hypothetical protein Pelo_14235 [Pelomyxa schiedti]|nr:hypothetical protein Pelo_14235 [Pelomyxa schiedti]
MFLWLGRRQGPEEGKTKTTTTDNEPKKSDGGAEVGRAAAPKTATAADGTNEPPRVVVHCSVDPSQADEDYVIVEDPDGDGDGKSHEQSLATATTAAADTCSSPPSSAPSGPGTSTVSTDLRYSVVPPHSRIIGSSLIPGAPVSLPSSATVAPQLFASLHSVQLKPLSMAAHEQKPCGSVATEHTTSGIHSPAFTAALAASEPPKPTCGIPAKPEWLEGLEQNQIQLLEKEGISTAQELALLLCNKPKYDQLLHSIPNLSVLAKRAAVILATEKKRDDFFLHFRKQHEKEVIAEQILEVEKRLKIVEEKRKRAELTASQITSQAFVHRPLLESDQSVLHSIIKKGTDIDHLTAASPLTVLDGISEDLASFLEHRAIPPIVTIKDFASVETHSIFSFLEPIVPNLYDLVCKASTLLGILYPVAPVIPPVTVNCPQPEVTQISAEDTSSTSTSISLFVQPQVSQLDSLMQSQLPQLQTPQQVKLPPCLLLHSKLSMAQILKQQLHTLPNTSDTPQLTLKPEMAVTPAQAAPPQIPKNLKQVQQQAPNPTQQQTPQPRTEPEPQHHHQPQPTPQSDLLHNTAPIVPTPTPAPAPAPAPAASPSSLTAPPQQTQPQPQHTVHVPPKPASPPHRSAAESSNPKVPTASSRAPLRLPPQPQKPQQQQQQQLQPESPITALGIDPSVCGALWQSAYISTLEQLSQMGTTYPGLVCVLEEAGVPVSALIEKAVNAMHM